jgi:cyanate permease
VIFLLPFALFAVRSPRPGEVEPAPEDEAVRPEAPSLPLAAALRTRSFWILAFALFAFYFYYLGVIQHLIVFLRDGGMSRSEAAGWFGLAVAMGIPGKLGMGLLADRIPIKTTLLATFGLVTLASFLLLRVDAPGFLVVFLVVHGFAVAAENVLLPLIVAECFGVLHMASIYGALMVALLPGGALGPVFAGWVYDTRDSYELAFVTFAVVNVTSLVALAFVRRETD